MLLKKGDKGEEVIFLQEKLNSIYPGANLIVDGIFGGETEKAVKIYRDIKGLNNVCDDTMWAVLNDNDSLDYLAEVAADEARKDISWRGNGIAKKYTKKFEPVFGTGRFPWCAAFVTWCVENMLSVYTDDGDLPINCPTGYTWALCEAWQKWGQAKGYYSDWTQNDGPERGDIILFDWDGATFPDTDFEDHMGICVKVQDNRYHCAEGNVRDQTAMKVRYKYHIQGWIRLPKNF